MSRERREGFLVTTVLVVVVLPYGRVRWWRENIVDVDVDYCKVGR